MYQTFEATTSPDTGPERLAALRDAMGPFDAFLVPRADAHQGEYVAPSDERLAWLTGFTGSAGFCAVLKDKAGIFIDGRYRLQVKDQTADVFTPVHWPEVQLSDWLIEHLKRGATVAYDPWLHTVEEARKLSKALAEAHIDLKPTDNLIDQVWQDQPPKPAAKFSEYPVEFAGKSAKAKLAEVTAELADGIQVITLPDSIAWLLNIRGTDIKRNPVPHAFLLLKAGGTADLFCRSGKAELIADGLSGLVTIRDENALLNALVSAEGPVRIDPKSCPHKLALVLAEADIQPEHAEDPCILPKAIKSETELKGARNAQLRDGVAMARFLAWVDLTAADGQLTEIGVVKKLEGFRRDTNQLLDISFETICGAGQHGAIVHYRVTEDTNRAVKKDELLLVDSGGQYIDGTTDITRTIIVGSPSDLHKSCYTRVLQGVIAISRARFPKGVAGQHLDALARFPLWTAGLDYDHGTGHGVGSYLSVHEGPQGLSRRSSVPLQAGMILSNEPGYYRAGAFGIRIENLIAVEPAPDLDGADDREMLAFETLTYVPFDRRLIDTDLLTRPEQAWVDAYHAQTLERLGPLLDGETLEWLHSACAPL